MLCAFRKRLPRHELQHQEGHTIVLLKIEQRGDVGMIQRSEEPRFPLESDQALFVLSEGFG
jgi:hypothetical protein